MPVLVWIAVLFGVWCVASAATALTLGTVLRRRREATDLDGALRPLDVGPLDLWVDGVVDIPDTLEGLFADPPELPGPRMAVDDHVEVLPERS